MAKSRRKELIEEIERLMFLQGDQRRFVPCWAQLRRYERVTRDDGESVVVPAEWRPHLYGGLWDRSIGAYVEGAKPEGHQHDDTCPEQCDQGQVAEIKCHAKQLEVLEYQNPPEKTKYVKRIMVLGGPGTGKTITLAIAVLLWGLDNPHFVIGMVGASVDRVEILWNDMEKIAGSLGFVADRHKHARGGPVMTLVNGAKYEFVAAKEPSRRMGSPIQGRSWHRAVIDETQSLLDSAQKDIDERGRVDGKRYRIIESATNISGGAIGGHFMQRREQYKSSPERDIIRLRPEDNVFVAPEHWESQRGNLSDHDWRQRMLAEDVPPEQLVYSGFLFGENVRPAPRDRAYDVTAEVTREVLGEPYLWVAGTDFGTLCTTSIWLKAYRLPGQGLVWWAMHETTSGSHSHAGMHARRLIGFANPADFIVIADPHVNVPSHQVDKSDYELTRREGVTIIPAVAKPPIPIKHRISMVNALFCDAAGKRRLFIDCDSTGKATCPKLATSLMSMAYDDFGNAESVRKDYSDPTHWPAALGYGLFRFERLRGLTAFEAVASEDPVLRRAQEIANRRGQTQR